MAGKREYASDAAKYARRAKDGTIFVTKQQKAESSANLRFGG
jgi:hypothetical protein